MTNEQLLRPKRECRLCGYRSTDYRVIPVPLSSPSQDNAVCAECLEELTAVDAPTNVHDHLVEQMRDPEFRREWEAHEDCFEEQKRLTGYIIRYRRLRDGYKTQRDEARTFAREAFAWADSYVPDSGWGEGWAELITRARALTWIKEPTNGQ